LSEERLESSVCGRRRPSPRAWCCRRERPARRAGDPGPPTTIRRCAAVSIPRVRVLERFNWAVAATDQGRSAVDCLTNVRTGRVGVSHLESPAGPGKEGGGRAGDRRVDGIPPRRPGPECRTTVAGRRRKFTSVIATVSSSSAICPLRHGPSTDDPGKGLASAECRNRGIERGRDAPPAGYPADRESGPKRSRNGRRGLRDRERVFGYL